MLGLVPFRIGSRNRSTKPPTVEPAPFLVEPVAPSTPAPDPVGIRVVPLRPASPWPPRRAHERVLNPFRAFPFRTMHLSRMMYAGEDD